MKLKRLSWFLVGAFVFSIFSTTAFAAGTVKIAFMDPMSGANGYVGDFGVKHVTFVADKIKAAGGFLNGTNFEFVPFDNKGVPQESLVQLKNIIDQRIRFLIQGNGSSVSGALIEAIKKHNQRNPDQSVLYFNYGGITPSFTEEGCDFWHFRFDAHVGMKIAAVTDAIKTDRKIKKVFLLNQDYSFGHSISAAAKEMLKAKRPDIEIVGDTFVPILKVKDFSPYVAKIQKSGAQAIITGNWGADMILFGKAVNESGLKIKFYTFYAGGLNVPSAMQDAMDGLRQVTEWHDNLAIEENKPADEAYRKEYNDKYAPDGQMTYYYGKLRTMIEMLAKAFDKAGSTDPKAVAYAMEGMKIETPYGTAVMGANDHQLLQTLFISRFTKVDGKKVKYDREHTGYGTTTEARTEALDTAIPSSCKMVRP